MEHGRVRPDSVVQRGPLVTRHFHESTGVHSMRAWCEMELDGARYQPFDRDFECSLGPVADPAAATLSVDGGPERGLHLLRFSDGAPSITRLSEDPTFSGAWTADGRWYLHERRAFPVRGGEVRRLPPFPGMFLALSPDERTLVSYVYELESGENTLHLVDVASGTEARITVKADAYPWLNDRTHVVPGTVESAHIWQALHLSWEKAPGGEYRLVFPPRP